MSKVDDELTRRLRRAERPVHGDDLFEGLARRRSHRERVRRVQAGLLAFAVLAGTAGGFVALREAFGEGGRDVGDPPALAANGEIVFSRPLPDGSEHLFAVTRGQEGERRITQVGHATYREPSISPDGQTIVVSHSIPSFEGKGIASVIATVPIEGGTTSWLTEPVGIVQDPEWSPDGTKIAFAGSVPGSGRFGIHVMNADGSEIRLIAGSDSFDVLSPDWSPDGSRIVFTGWNDGVTQPDLYSIALDGSEPTNLTKTPDVEEHAAAWSPDGSLIAFIARPVGTAEGTIELVTPGGNAAEPLPGIDDGVALGELDWSPDGRFIAFLSDLALTDSDTDGDLDLWAVRPDGSDLRNLTTEGASGLAWQPLPAGSEPEPSSTSEPTVSPSAEPAGRDIGLGFNVCNLERLGGIDFLGDGARGQAWTAAEVKDNGTCPEPSLGHTYLVVADFDGDGVADASSRTVEFCFFCRPFETVDFDADGEDELVVMASEGTTPTFMVYDVRGIDGSRRIEPVLVAEPGHREAGEDAGEPISFSTGGDEGYAGWVRCDDFPAAPVLVITWRDHPIEGDTMEVHETRLVLEGDGMFHVVGGNDYSTAVGEPIPGVSDEPACGVDWQILD